MCLTVGSAPRLSLGLTVSEASNGSDATVLPRAPTTTDRGMMRTQLSRLTQMPADTVGTFIIYTDKAHEGFRDLYPDHYQPLIVVRDTYAEAEAEAKRMTQGTADWYMALNPDAHIRWIHHPVHSSGVQDPLDYFGSWGWKTE